MTIKEAFKKYKNGELTKIEIRKKIKEATDNHAPESLKEVKKVLGSYIFRIRRDINVNLDQIFPPEIFPLPYNSNEIVAKYLHKDIDQLRANCNDIIVNEFNDKEIKAFEFELMMKEWREMVYDLKLSNQEAEKFLYIYLLALLQIAKTHGELAVFGFFDIMKLKKLEQEIDELIKGSIEKTKEIEVTRETISREYIFEYCKSLKEDGMTVVNMFEKVENLLLNELDFTREEVKERFNFSLNEPYHFNKFLSNHI